MLVPILVLTGLLVVSALIAAGVAINARGKRRKAKEERERLECEARERAEKEISSLIEAGKQRRELERQRAEEERERLEREARERAEKEESSLIEAGKQRRGLERRKAEEERKRLERERKRTIEEVRSRERRTPVKRGGRPRGLEQKGEIGRPPRTRPHSLKPELVCWKDGWRWCVGIEVPEGSETLNISQREEVLERDPLDESRYPLRHIGGVVKLAWTSEEEYIPLLSTERNYLIFKMRKDWKGLGRSIRYPTMGHYLVIVPLGWTRDEEVSGPASVNPEDIQSDGYKAHFFYQEKDGQLAIGFIDANGERIRIESGGHRFEIIGKEIEDDSEDMGALFKEPPCIRALDKTSWTEVGVIVVGKEGRGKNRWRTQYIPHVSLIENELPQEIADQRGGWYFLRIYDNCDDLLESMDFRFLMTLDNIRVESSGFLPGPDGYDDSTIRFLHQASCRIELVDNDIRDNLQIQREAGQTLVTVPPYADCDKSHWILRDGDAEVEVTVLVERIWWTYGNVKITPTVWNDKLIDLSRKYFTATSELALWVKLPRFRFLRKINVGFDRVRSRSFQIEVGKKELVVPFRDFCDSDEIQNPRQDCILQIFMEFQDKTYSVPLFRISTSFRCKKCEFVTTSEQEALSHITEHLSDIIPHLSYEDLWKRHQNTLPRSIYECSYCGFIVKTNDIRSPTSAIIDHIQQDCKKALYIDGLVRIAFYSIDKVEEVRRKVEANLPIIYRCEMCGKEFKGDDQKLRLNHLQENHKYELIETL